MLGPAPDVGDGWAAKILKWRIGSGLGGAASLVDGNPSMVMSAAAAVMLNAILEVRILISFNKKY